MFQFLLHLAIIEKNVRNGINGYFKPLAEVLAQESDKVASNVDQPRKKKRYTKHRALSNQRLTSRTSNGAVHGTKSTVSNEQSTEVCSWFALVGFGFYLNLMFFFLYADLSFSEACYLWSKQ